MFSIYELCMFVFLEDLVSFQSFSEELLYYSVLLSLSLCFFFVSFFLTPSPFLLLLM